MTSTFPHSYALLIGVGRTACSAWSLPVTVQDARAIGAILADPKLCAYRADHLRVLHDDGATRDAILDGLASLAEQATADAEATVVVYYSGHGWLDTDTGRYYLVQHDTQPDDIAGSALAADEFTDALRRIPARRVLVVLDCCHAEGMATGKEVQPISKLPAGFTLSALPKSLVDDLKQGAGRAVFTSSRGEQPSWVRPDGTMSLYTYHLIEALQGAGNRPGDTAVRLSHLIGHLGAAVPASARAMGRAQNPFFDTATEDFPVALLRSGKGLPLGGWAAIQHEVAEAIRRVVHAIGARSVAIGGDASGSTIITDSGNILQQGKYSVHLGQASGVAIGDNARSVQTTIHGNVTGSQVTTAGGDITIAAPSNASAGQHFHPTPSHSRSATTSAGPPLIPMETQIQRVSLKFQIQGRRVQIVWHADIFGDQTTSFKPPYNEEILPLVIKALDAIQYPDHPHTGPRFTADEQTALAKLGLWKDNRVPNGAHKIVGHALYQALGPEGRTVLDAARNYGIAQDIRTNYVLRFPRDGVRLAAHPWELIADQDQAVLLGRGTDIDSCERYMNIDKALPPPLHRSRKPHLLALLPNFGISEQIRREEHATRRATWDRLRDAGHITYDELTPLTRRMLSEYLRSAANPPDIIHYFGHGLYRDGEGYLLFDDPNDSKSLVSATELASILGRVRVVVIHACQSAMFSEEGGLLTGIGPALSLVTGATVAMQLTIQTTAAARFAQVFYDELLVKRRSLQEAVAAGRQTLFFERGSHTSWYVPTLYIRSREQQPVYLLEG